VKAIKDYTDGLVGAVTLQQVLNYNHSLLNGLNFQGTDAGLTNTGTTDVTGIGTNAAKGNSGEYVVAIGENSGLNNTKNHLYAIGNGAGAQNTGLYVSAIGSAAALQNSGDFVNAIGDVAGAANEGDNVNALGYAAADTNTGNHVNAIGRSAGVNNTFNDVTLLGNTASASADDQLVFINGAGFNARLSNTNLTANHKYELPNSDGTLVLSVNGNLPNATTGDVTVSISAPYLIYTAIITLGSGSVSSVNVLENTIGDGSGDGINDIAWSATFFNVVATMTAGPFTSSKTAIVPSLYFGSGLTFSFLGVRTSASVLTFTSRRTDTSATSNAFQPVFVEIRVYP
jgi:hypothetical protein